MQNACNGWLLSEMKVITQGNFRLHVPAHLCLDSPLDKCRVGEWQFSYAWRFP